MPLRSLILSIHLIGLIALSGWPMPVFAAMRGLAHLTLQEGGANFVCMKINLDNMQAAADQASDLLKSLANRHRLLILCRLADGEHSVGQLAEFLGIRDSTVSQHLALLRREKLIAARRDGQTIWYHIESAPAREVVNTLYRCYCPQDETA